MNKHKQGFNLVEVVVAIGVFLVFAFAIYTSIQFTFRVIQQSRIRIVETALLNEQVEIIRNIPFENIGIINGSPAGVLERTVTTTRDAIEYEITRTVRSIDDPYDGTIGGDPQDLSPADYKLVQIDIICTNCIQRVPVSFTTIVAPKYLEGDPTHGALFIQVFDSLGEPVQGATVHITTTSTDPIIDLEDTTDNEGFLRLVDLPEGLFAYHISIEKDGHTSDATIIPTEDNPNPVKIPATVLAQDVSNASFTINPVSTIELETIDEQCNVVGNAQMHIDGTLRVGIDPDVYKVDEEITTAANGTYSWQSLDPATYYFRPLTHDIIGAIPSTEVVLAQNSTEQVQLLLGPNLGNSLLVHAYDSVTDQPVSGASIRVHGNGFDSTKVTGFGSIGQTDWSGGSGQLTIGSLNEYFSDDGFVSVSSPAGEVHLTQVGEEYVASGELESSIFDFGLPVNFVRFDWDPFTQPVEAGEGSLRIQIATSNSSSPASWEYKGPDGTDQTYYTSEQATINDIHDNTQYARYKLFLTTQSPTTTPRISELQIMYTLSCTPPGQVYFPTLADGEYTVDVDAQGYTTSSQNVTINGGDITFFLEMYAE